jgi:phosphate transport system permease protein
MIARGFGTAAILILLVLTLFALARLIGGTGPGQLSRRRRLRVDAASERDLQRMSVRGDLGPGITGTNSMLRPTSSPTDLTTKETSS